MATTPQPLPMFGAWNEHWFNHPAGLPVSKYKPNTNANTGAASVDAAYNAYRAAQGTQAPGPTTPATPDTPATPTPTAWNQWYVDFSGTPPASPGTPQTTPSPSSSTTPALSSQYTPAMMQQLYENPWYILGDVFQGIAPTSPLYQQLRDIGADPLALYNMIQGRQEGTTGGVKEFTDWLGQMYKGQGTAGASSFNAQDLLGSLFGQTKFGADAKNALGQILGAGDMSAQNRTLYNLARDASNVSLNPVSARAYQAALSQALDRYGDTMLGSSANQTMGPVEWIRQNAPWLAIGA